MAVQLTGIAPHLRREPGSQLGQPLPEPCRRVLRLVPGAAHQCMRLDEPVRRFQGGQVAAVYGSDAQQVIARVRRSVKV